jgi:hypothetical protein
LPSIERELRAAVKSAFGQGGRGVADVALKAAGLLAGELKNRGDDFGQRAPAVILALLEVVGTAQERRHRASERAASAALFVWGDAFNVW